MRNTRVLGTVATLGIAVLAMGAVPAFTADNGTVNVSVTASAPAGPCIEVTGTDVSFGTLPFSSTSQTGFAYGNVNPRFRNCSTVDEDVAIEGSDATGPAATWALVPGLSNCGGSSPALDEYHLSYFVDGGNRQSVTKAKTALLTSAAPAASPDHELVLQLITPCVGSKGAGQTFAASVVLTATLG
jgi:hypothetical protein